MAISIELLAATDGSEQRLRAAAPFPAFSSPAGDEALVIAAKNGDEEAFEILVKRYWRRTLAVAFRLTRAQEDAEDVTQQSLQKAFVHLHEFEGKSSFSTWLTRIAINESLMFLRRRRGQRYASLDDDFILGEGAASRLEIPDSDPDPEASCIQQEAQRILSAAINTLTPGQRKAIELRDLEELSTEDTARSMGLSVAAVKSRLLHGRRKLRKALRGYLKSPRIREVVAGNARSASRDRVICAASG